MLHFNRKIGNTEVTITQPTTNLQPIPLGDLTNVDKIIVLCNALTNIVAMTDRDTFNLACAATGMATNHIEMFKFIDIVKDALIHH